MKSELSAPEKIRGESHPVRGAWIEINGVRTNWRKCVSHPVRGAWIEIIRPYRGKFGGLVAPREGCVD